MAAIVGDWAAITEADESCNQTSASSSPLISLIKKSKKSLSTSTSSKTAAEDLISLVVSSSPTKKSLSKSNSGLVNNSSTEIASLTKEDESQTSGTSSWVLKQLDSVGLSRVGEYLSSHFPLQLIVWTEDHHIEALLQMGSQTASKLPSTKSSSKRKSTSTSSSSGIEPPLDTLEWIKLQCLIKSMRVAVQNGTGNSRSNQKNPTTSLATSNHNTSSIVNNKFDMDTLLKTDIATWDEETVLAWLQTIPSLKHLTPSFKACEVDGQRLLAINDRALVQKFKIDSELERFLVLSHVQDLKALQITRGFSHHTEIMSKVLSSLSSELNLLAKNAGHTRATETSKLDFHISDSSPSIITKQSSTPSKKVNGQVKCAEGTIQASKMLSLPPAGSLSNSSPDHVLSSAMNDLVRSGSSSSISSQMSTTMSSQGKRVPNYFLSLRIANANLRAAVKKIQKELETAIPELQGSRSVLPPEQLHFTLGRLYLHSEVDVKHAKQLLVECQQKAYQSLYPNGAQVAVTFRGVTNYGGNTVFLETERGQERDTLIEFGNTVYDVFYNAGLTSKEFRFQPVAPILRVRQSKKPLMQKLQEASVTLLEPYTDQLLGRDVFTSLDISAVAHEVEEDGYYKLLASVPLE